MSSASAHREDTRLKYWSPCNFKLLLKNLKAIAPRAPMPKNGVDKIILWKSERN